MQLTAITGTMPNTLSRPTTSGARAASGFSVSRSTYDAHQSEEPVNGLGSLVRKDNQAPTGDASIDAAHDNAAIVVNFYHDVLGRNSIDDHGMRIDSIVHYGVDYNNAYWDGEKMTYGDGDGKLLAPLSKGLDVVGHEMTHGVTQHTSGLEYRGQTGALNESWSDVMGELIEQWHDNPTGFGTVDAARAADWLIGEDVMTPGIAGDALRSMKSPGTAYPGDDQPADMAHYVRTFEDNGGVHINSGIPNRAAYNLAVKIGSEKLAKIWYTAATTYLTPNAKFADAAAATIAAATKLYGNGPDSQAVADAWKGVGVLPATTPASSPVAHRSPVVVRTAGAPDEGTMFPANYVGPALRG